MKINKYNRKKCLQKQYEINEVFSFPYDFDKRAKETCVSNSRMNAMFDIPHNFRLRVKFSTHMLI